MCNITDIFSVPIQYIKIKVNKIPIKTSGGGRHFIHMPWARKYLTIAVFHTQSLPTLSHSVHGSADKVD